MAGIGFRLQKVLQKDTYLDALKAYFYSALILAGPWILSVVSFIALSYFNPSTIDMFELMYFKTTIIYVFAFSLILAGFLYLSLSRYLSDKLFLKDEGALAPAFNSSLLLVLGIQFVAGMGLFFFQETSMEYRILSVMIFMVIGVIWLELIFLTALRDYNSIIFSYGLGTLITIVLCYILGSNLGLIGYFIGYFTGHFVIITLLAVRIFIEFPSRRIFDPEMFSFLINNKDIVMTGFFYNLAIWIDKFIFWTSSGSVNITNILRSHHIYDGAVFLAYFTIIPALSIFLIEVETDFYTHYKIFYSTVLNKGRFQDIKHAKKGMADSLKKSIGMVLLSQGMVTLIMITFAPELAIIFKLQPIQITVFKISALGAYLHSALLIMIIIILYFDFKKLALWISLIFLTSNGIFTFITANMELQYMGYGYFCAALVTLASAFYWFEAKFRKLEYITFATQPIAVHQEGEL